MALPGLLSPVKSSMARMVCSPSKLPQLSPLNAKVNALIGSPGSTAKRSLAALHQGFTAVVAGCSPAAPLLHLSNSTSSPAPKRLEKDAAVFAQPVTPLVAEPASSQVPPVHTPAAGDSQHQLRQSAVPLQPQPRPITTSQPLPQQQQQQQRTFSSSSSSADTTAAADQLPPPSAVLELPPECEEQLPAAAAEAQRGSSSSKPGGVHAAMFGRRVSARYDIPLGTDWAVGAPDHMPRLGEGRLELIMGPMFAGKTTRLITRVQELCSAENKLAVAVKSAEDVRYGCHWVVTHDGRCMRCYTSHTLAEFKELMGAAYHKLQVIAVDEAQFFPDLLQFCRQAVDIDGKQVIVAGLSGDFRRQRFGQLMDLMPLADSITQLTSECTFCGDRALFSLRLVDGGPQALVGGEDKYRATCRRCYLTHSGVMQ